MMPNKLNDLNKAFNYTCISFSVFITFHSKNNTSLIKLFKSEFTTVENLLSLCTKAELAIMQ